MARLNFEEEDPRVELYRTAIQDARYVLNAYQLSAPAEAWETIHKILFDPKLRITTAS